MKELGGGLAVRTAAWDTAGDREAVSKLSFNRHSFYPGLAQSWPTPVQTGCSHPLKPAPQPCLLFLRCRNSNTGLNHIKPRVHCVSPQPDPHGPSTFSPCTSTDRCSPKNRLSPLLLPGLGTCSPHGDFSTLYLKDLLLLIISFLPDACIFSREAMANIFKLLITQPVMLSELHGPTGGTTCSGQHTTPTTLEVGSGLRNTPCPRGPRRRQQGRGRGRSLVPPMDPTVVIY